jgi:hypothetical protein
MVEVVYTLAALVTQPAVLLESSGAGCHRAVTLLPPCGSTTAAQPPRARREGATRAPSRTDSLERQESPVVLPAGPISGGSLPGNWLEFTRWGPAAALGASHLQGPKTLITTQLDHLLSLVPQMVSTAADECRSNRSVTRRVSPRGRWRR